MKTPDRPVDEQARLETLRLLKILDTPPEERFDRITRMALKLFNVPIALVSLVDENRQWFKSCIGLNSTETPRDISFCGHAILGDDLFIIPNALEDERFANNPLVVSNPYIRFYAGCPLKAPNGHKLGTLCIIDLQPRDLGKDDLATLVDLASMVEHELAAIQLATMDELTNIPNRRGFVFLAQHSLNFCVRNKYTVVMIFFDLDKFKPINDRFGHAEGDLVLTFFAEQMKSSFRTSDILARLGGDEFAALLPNTSMDTAETTVARLQSSIDKYNKNSDRGYEISFSNGIVEFDPEKHSTIEDLLADADSLMYKTKRSKR